jgi:hypothetical protein
MVQFPILKLGANFGGTQLDNPSTQRNTKMKDYVSLFKFSGLPDSFGVILLAFTFILVLAPYFSGADFGLFKVPLFTTAAKKWLKIIGPVIFVTCVFSFIPVIPIKNSAPADLNNKNNPSNITGTANDIITKTSTTSTAPQSQPQSDPELTVDFDVSTFSGAEILIGNEGQHIFVLRDLTINWEYSKCPEFERPTTGAPLIEYRYEVNLTTSKGSKLLDSKTFKYGSGDADKFHVDLHYPGYGVYTIWLSFKYKRLGKQTEQIYETRRKNLRFARILNQVISLRNKPQPLHIDTVAVRLSFSQIRYRPRVEKFG